MSSALDSGTPSNDDDQGDITRGDDAAQIRRLLKHLLQRGSKGELHPSELASQVLSLIQQRVAAACARRERTSQLGDTPGLEEMGWMLWGIVDEMARQDQRHHDGLVAFINAFWPLLQTQPWSLWGSGMRETSFVLGPSFRESLQGAGPRAWLAPGVPGATEEEQRMHSWCNYCRFVARMTRDTERDFSLYLLCFAREALEDFSWPVCEYPDAAVLAFEGVIDVCGVQVFQNDTDFGRMGRGGDGKRQWKGKSGFCRERWLFWEAGLLDIAQDEAHYAVPSRDSASRTASKMQSIRRGHMDIEQ